MTVKVAWIEVIFFFTCGSNLSLPPKYKNLPSSEMFVGQSSQKIPPDAARGIFRLLSLSKNAQYPFCVISNGMLVESMAWARISNGDAFLRETFGGLMLCPYLPMNDWVAMVSAWFASFLRKSAKLRQFFGVLTLRPFFNNDTISTSTAFDLVGLVAGWVAK
jgi:hypothetical protein